MADRRLHPAPYCVDNESLQRRARELAADRTHLRHQLGIDGPDPVILFVGKLVTKKDPLTLLAAFHVVRQRLPCHLLVVGEGPLEIAMRQWIQSRDVLGVTFAGFLNRSEITAAYAAADVFCLPSTLHETWGIVVNEAMNFSLAIVVSDKVGCAKDLVREGDNGHVVAAGDPAALAVALAGLVGDPGRRHQYGQRSLEMISAWHVGLAVDGIATAAIEVCGRGVRLD
jgi:glycosyltransferase involved in cell wall biosynthesis